MIRRGRERYDFLFGFTLFGAAACCTACAPAQRAKPMLASGPMKPSRTLIADGTFEQLPPYDAPPETLNRGTDVPEGRVSEPSYYPSRSYPGWSFEYEIYVPAQYDPKTPAALMVFQDGVHYVGLTEAKFNSKNTFDNLIARGEMPVTIALFVNPGTPSGTYRYPDEKLIRSEQYDAIDDKYGQFLLTELIPALITSKYNITTDPEGWAIGGHSSGGICAFNVAFHHPEKFRRVLTHNGSFVHIRGGDAYPRLVRETPPKPLKVMLLSGTRDLNIEFGNWLEANDEMAPALSEQHYRYRYLRGEGAHYPPAQAVADYPTALRWLWQDYVPAE